MIEFEIKGEIPTPVLQKQEAFEAVGAYMKRRIEQRFERGGSEEEPWPALKSGSETPLVASGRLKRSGGYEVGDDFVRIFWGRGVPYAAIHNFGGTIKHPGSDKLQVFRFGGKTIFTTHTAAHDIPIPQRLFMFFEERDKQEIMKILGTTLVNFETDRGSKSISDFESGLGR